MRGSHTAGPIKVRQGCEELQQTLQGSRVSIACYVHTHIYIQIHTHECAVYMCESMFSVLITWVLGRVQWLSRRSPGGKGPRWPCLMLDKKRREPEKDALKSRTVDDFFQDPESI